MTHQDPAARDPGRGVGHPHAEEVAVPRAGVEQDPAPVPGDVDVEPAKAGEQRRRGGRDGHEAPIAVDQVDDLAQDRRHRGVVGEAVGVVDEHGEVRVPSAHCHERVGLGRPQPGGAAEGSRVRSVVRPRDHHDRAPRRPGRLGQDAHGIRAT